jgi:predicted transcriptional regulator
VIDKNFSQKLASCIHSLPALQEVVSRNTDKSENTIKTIINCLEHGTIVWTKNGNQFDYKIKVHTKGHNPAAQEESKQAVQMVKELIYNQDQIS